MVIIEAIKTVERPTCTYACEFSRMLTSDTSVILVKNSSLFWGARGKQEFDIVTIILPSSVLSFCSVRMHLSLTASETKQRFLLIKLQCSVQHVPVQPERKFDFWGCLTSVVAQWVSPLSWNHDLLGGKRIAELLSRQLSESLFSLKKSIIACYLSVIHGVLYQR